jgi:hypothetical protein
MPVVNTPCARLTPSRCSRSTRMRLSCVMNDLPLSCLTTPFIASRSDYLRRYFGNLSMTCGFQIVSGNDNIPRFWAPRATTLCHVAETFFTTCHSRRWSPDRPIPSESHYRLETQMYRASPYVSVNAYQRLSTNCDTISKSYTSMLQTGGRRIIGSSVITTQ